MWSAFARGDARFDGRFVAGVRSTGIFCRPSCTCRKPRPDRVEYFASAAAAVAAGFRPCKRCRPELAGGAAEAARRIADRALALMRARLDDRWSTESLARAMHMSASSLARHLREADGRAPMRALADLRAERAMSLLQRSEDSVLEIGYAAGFGSPAAMARAFRRRYGATPLASRRAHRRAGHGGGER